MTRTIQRKRGEFPRAVDEAGVQGRVGVIDARIPAIRGNSHMLTLEHVFDPP